MKVFKNIFDFFINSSVWVAVSVCALVLVTYLNHDVPVNYTLLLLIFSGTIVGYNFVKYFEESQLISSRFIDVFSGFFTYKKLIFYLSLIAMFVTGVCLFCLKIRTLLLLLLPMLLTFFYAVSFKEKTLRKISGIKIYIVGLVWTVVTVLVPLQDTSTEITTDVWVSLIQRFAFVLLLILPFDIRDMDVDDVELKTLPQRIGVKYTKMYGLLLAMLFLLLEFFKDEVLEVNLLVLPIVFITSILFLVFATEKQSKYYSSFFVEGIPVFWLLLLLIL